MDVCNPRPFLQQLINHPVVVQLKWNLYYTGILQSYDSFFNIELSEAVEHSTKREIGKVGRIFVRCNNVQFVKKVNS